MTIDEQKKQFVELYNKESDSLFRFCLLRVSEREQALDITQETFTRFWQAIVAEKFIQNPRAFLFTIARNLIIDWYRKIKVVSLDAFSEEDHEFDFPDEGAFGKIEMNSEVGRIISMIQKLEPQYREVVYLRFVEDVPPRDIAEILKISVNITSIRISRGMKFLKKLMEGNTKNE